MQKYVHRTYTKNGNQEKDIQEKDIQEKDIQDKTYYASNKPTIQMLKKSREKFQKIVGRILFLDNLHFLGINKHTTYIYHVYWSILYHMTYIYDVYWSILYRK